MLLPTFAYHAPKAFEELVKINGYFAGYAQRRSASQVWPKNSMGLRAHASH